MQWKKDNILLFSILKVLVSTDPSDVQLIVKVIISFSGSVAVTTNTESPLKAVSALTVTDAVKINKRTLNCSPDL